MGVEGQTVVNDIFWANYAADKIYTSFERRAKSVDNLQAFIKWTFSLFTGSGLILTYFGKGDIGGQVLVILGAGFFLLMAGYYFAANCGFPITENINPNEALSIKKAYSDAIRKSDRNFNLANIVTMLGAFALALGILLQFNEGADKKKKDDEKAAILAAAKTVPHRALMLNAYLQKSGDDLLVPFITRGDKNSVVSIRISAVDSFMANKIYPAKDTELFSGSFPADTAGISMGVFPLPKKMKKRHLILTAVAGKSNSDAVTVVVKKLNP